MILSHTWDNEIYTYHYYTRGIMKFTPIIIPDFLSARLDGGWPTAAGPRRLAQTIAISARSTEGAPTIHLHAHCHYATAMLRGCEFHEI